MQSTAVAGTEGISTLWELIADRPPTRAKPMTTLAPRLSLLFRAISDHQSRFRFSEQRVSTIDPHPGTLDTKTSRAPTQQPLSSLEARDYGL